LKITRIGRNDLDGRGTAEPGNQSQKHRPLGGSGAKIGHFEKDKLGGHRWPFQFCPSLPSPRVPLIPLIDNSGVKRRIHENGTHARFGVPYR
jgi:hypothetical protein